MTERIQCAPYRSSVIDVGSRFEREGERNLAYAFREGNGKSAAWVVVSEKGFRNSLTAEFAREPCVQYSGDEPVGVIDSGCPAVKHNEHYRLAQSIEPHQKFSLPTR